MLTLIFGLIVIARFIGDAILLGVLIDTELPPSCNEERLKMSNLADNSLKYMLISEPLIWTKLNWDFHVWFTYNMQLIAYLHMNQHFHSRSHSEPTGKHLAMLLYAWCLYDLPEHLSFPLPSRIRNLSQAHVRIISHWLRQLYITSRKYKTTNKHFQGLPFHLELNEADVMWMDYWFHYSKQKSEIYIEECAGFL